MKNSSVPRNGAKRKPEKPGQVAGRMSDLRERRKAAGQHRVELWLTDAEEQSVKDHLARLRT